MSLYPTLWQQKILWGALTALALALFGVLAFYAILLLARTLNFLQPILIPIAVAGVMAYLLSPVVDWFCRRRVPRAQAVWLVFALVLLPLGLLLAWVTPELYHQSLLLAERVPSYVSGTQKWVIGTIESYQTRYAGNPYVNEVAAWMQEQLPKLPPKIWQFVGGWAEGLFGVLGFLIGIVLVPICLFFFLRDAGSISRRWSDYLPLRTSSFKNEVVSCLTEINGYLIAFFRGQMLISLIDGIMIGVALLLLGLNFALLIGMMVAVLAMIPFIGITLCWIPAVVIAAVQWQDWQHPLVVTLIFVAIQQIEGWWIVPKIQSKSVGLHPLTIIVAVFAWSLLIGGLLGALLAVPLTATLKVLLKRYVWERQIVRRHIPVPVGSGRTSITVEVPE